MKKTTIFKKGISLDNFEIDYSFENIRSKDDAIIASSLGYELDKNPDAKYLEKFNNDFSKINPEHKARYVAVWDFETTDKFNAFGVSLAIMLYDIQEEEVIEQFYELMNPLETISKGAYNVHKISQEQVANEKTFIEHLPEIEAIFEKADFFVGHNLQFDLNVLEREYQRAEKINKFSSIPVFDTMKAAKDILQLKDKNGKKLKPPTLIECVDYYGLNTEQGFHNALIDVQETLNIFRELLDEEF